MSRREVNRGGHFLLFLAKSFCFLDGKQQLLFQLFKALIGRQIQTVKTGEQTKEERFSIKGDREGSAGSVSR